MSRSIVLLASVVLGVWVSGCASPRPRMPAPIDPAEPLADAVQLTSGFARAGEAYFSRDMQWIVFQATAPGDAHYHMYVARLKWAGGAVMGIDDPILISEPNSRNTCGYFSPDGRSLLFASTAWKERADEPTGGYQREGRNYRWQFPEGMEIWKVSIPAGKSMSEAELNEPMNRVALTSNNVYDAECAYSPDGRHICFTRGAGAEADIYIMRADGSRQIRITRAQGYDGGPFFSPDGRRIVYRSDRTGNDLLQIYVADLTFDAAGEITGAENERQLTNDANVNWGPSWFPDGRHIVYSTSAHGHDNYELYTMRDDGSDKTRLTWRAGADILPVVSPDGRWLLWTSKRTKDNTSQVFAARLLAAPARTATRPQ